MNERTSDGVGRRVLVTGAGGFIGRALCARLTSEGALVTGLDVDESLSDRVTGAGATFRRCDTADADDVRSALDAELVRIFREARLWTCLGDSDPSARS